MDGGADFRFVGFGVVVLYRYTLLLRGIVILALLILQHKAVKIGIWYRHLG